MRSKNRFYAHSLRGTVHDPGLWLPFPTLPSHVQAVLKDGTAENRLVLAIKPLRPLAGEPRMLEDLIAAEAAEAAGAPVESTPAVPGLALHKVSRSPFFWAGNISKKALIGLTERTTPAGQELWVHMHLWNSCSEVRPCH